MVQLVKMPKKQQSKLAVQPVSRVFRFQEEQAAEERLQQYLVQQQESTQLCLITREQDILLHNNFKVRGVFTLTTTALQHLCSKLAPGLLQAISHVSGLKADKRSHDRDSIYSDEAAAGIINRLIRLRFANLKGQRMILDHRSKTVDGLVGTNYEFFSNSDFFTSAREFVYSLWPDAELYEGLLCDRRLWFSIRDQEPVAIVRVRPRQVESFYQGFYFSNAEISGFSLKAATALMRESGGGVAISPFVDGGRISHVQNNDFMQQLQSLFMRAAQRLPSSDFVIQRITALAGSRLGFDGSSEHYKRRRSQLAGQLQHRGVSRDVAESVLDYAVFLSSTDDKPGQYDASKVHLGVSRTLFDLFVALLEIAGDQNIRKREALQQLAYEVLVGKFNIG